MRFFSKALLAFIIFFTHYFINAQCSDEIQNIATGTDAMVWSYHNKIAGADCVAFYNNTNTEVTVSNDHNNQPWARYLVKINSAFNGLAAGDQLSVSLDAEVISGQGRVEFNVNNTANTAIGYKTFNTSGNYNATLTIPNGATSIDIWLFSNYTLSTPGSVIYKNLSVSKVAATDTQNPTAPTNLVTSNVTSSTVDLNWDASTDNVGVTSYTLFTNGTNGVNVGNGTSHQVTGLSPSTTYSFLLQALDAAGNVSGNSNIITATTTSSGGGGSGQWATNADGIHYSNGNVGIGGTANPNYKLQVTGEIRSESFAVQSNGAYRVALGGGEDGYIAGRDNSNTQKFFIESNGNSFFNGGNVGIGTTAPDAPLTVKGRIHAQEVKVDLQGALAPDYVFYDDYDLRSLEEVQEYIDTHGHLPNIPSAAQMEEEGIELGEMNMKLLEKIEELTLYILEQDKKQRKMEKRIDELEKNKN